MSLYIINNSFFKIYKGIRNTTTVFDENDIAPARLPRYVGRDGILKVYAYSFYNFFCLRSAAKF